MKRSVSVIPRRQWSKSLSIATAWAFCLMHAVLHAQNSAGVPTGIQIMADAKAPGTPLAHFWSKVVGAGRANEGLRATWQDELHTVVEYDGFQYVRFHGIFHDDMFVYQEGRDGKVTYNFQYVDDLYDRMLANHARPFVELAFMPSDLATVKNTVFWWRANGSPPKDDDKWADLVKHFVEHCIARYGKEEVEKWYFEVWNEPNLNQPFFRGTQQQYFELYKVTALTLKRIDPKLRVGGPATSNFQIDQEALKVAQASSKPFDYPKDEIQLTEWSSSPSKTDHTHDSLAAAAFIAKTNLESIGLADSLSYWVFTDVFEEGGSPGSIFYGGFGLINGQQIVKPAFHAYRFLNQLGDQTLQQTMGGIVTRDSKTHRVAAVFYNYPPEMKVSVPFTGSVDAADKMDASGSARDLDLKITHLSPGVSFTIETLDREHGNAVAAWEAMGKPEPPGLAETDSLRTQAWATKQELVHADANGNLVVKRPLDAWTVVLIKQK